jgi:hypothetical protein
MGDASENAERPILNVEGNLVAPGPLRRDLLPLYQRWINDLGTMRTLGLAPLPMTSEKEQDWYDTQHPGHGSGVFPEQDVAVLLQVLQVLCAALRSLEYPFGIFALIFKKDSLS